MQASKHSNLVDAAIGCNRPLVAATDLATAPRAARYRRQGYPTLPQTTQDRLAAATAESYNEQQETIGHSASQSETILYLAYGSNLSDETFRRSRGIRPLSQVNVQVPSLRLTFDLPGIPYTEPCFANSGSRDPGSDDPSESHDADNEKTPLLTSHAIKKGYRKDRWHKGLIGVVYEVTPEDYAHIIATEGGGSGYHDILVDCHPFDSSDPSQKVPQNPTTPSFKAHTLFAPAAPPSESPPKDGDRFQRPDTSYAQASARYLKLITDGAAERELPLEYCDFLHSLRPYTMTTTKQRVGQFIFTTLWLPIMGILFGMGRVFADENGRWPEWLRKIIAAVMKAAWGSYDNFFFGIFGDGERTINDSGVPKEIDGKHEAASEKLSPPYSDRLISPHFYGSDVRPLDSCSHLV